MRHTKTGNTGGTPPGRTTPIDTGDAPHEPSGGTRHPRPDAVVIEDLVVTFGDVVALQVDRLSLPAGALTAVIGPNGSGKTTLLRTVSGLQEPNGGRLLVHGDRPGRHHVAHVLQTMVVNESLPVTVDEVVRMGRYRQRGLFRRLTAADRAAVKRAIERTDIADLRGRHLHELSGGQRQRVHLAQGLAQEADTLLLDEPVTGLDMTSLDRVTAVLGEETAQGRTVVLTTHELHTAQAADHVVLLSGHVIASGPPESVLTSAHLAEAYGGHLHELPGGELIVDQPDPHG